MIIIIKDISICKFETPQSCEKSPVTNKVGSPARVRGSETDSYETQNICIIT